MWRQLTAQQRVEILSWRKKNDRPWHSPPHLPNNYVHNNPVHHGYVRLWTEWPWSSAGEYLEQLGRAEAERVWKEYPILDYGKTWDEAAI